MRLLWVIPGYYGLFRVIMGFCRTVSDRSEATHENTHHIKQAYIIEINVILFKLKLQSDVYDPSSEFYLFSFIMHIYIYIITR